ncbi:MAG: transglutaminase family protein [Planctomycetaceae bacterium]
MPSPVTAGGSRFSRRVGMTNGLQECDIGPGNLRVVCIRRSLFTPLTFDIVDLWRGESVGGCRFHVDHPGGLNPATYPVNALEAECRRAARFLQFGHTGGQITLRDERLGECPYTLDLRFAV